jgi:CheY-like chemotaxis protein/ribonuclease BN (tRNA processing enzyme)
VDILIFDDDTSFAEMLSRIAISEGFTAEKYFDGSQALEAIRQARPRLVILDIMMPGLDGLSICKTLKSEPETADVKVMFCTAKAFEKDRLEALQCKADSFVGKAGGIEPIRQNLKELLGTKIFSPLPDLTPRKPVTMRARVQGCFAQEGSSTAPTDCVTLEFGRRLLILDAGSGLASFKPQTRPKQAWLFLSHCGESQLSGLPAIRSVLEPDSLLKVGGPLDTSQSLGAVLAKRLGPEPLPGLEAFKLAEGSFQPWEDIQVRTLWARHPGATLAYRVEFGNKSIAYCPVNELEQAAGKTLPSDFNRKFGRFIRAADVLIHDARYSDEEFRMRAGQGHSCPSLVMNLAAEFGVRKVLLFHLDPNASSAGRDESLKALLLRMSKAACWVPLSYARPGTIVEV